MHEVTLMVVVIAVSMDMTSWMMYFIVSFFIIRVFSTRFVLVPTFAYGTKVDLQREVISLILHKFRRQAGVH